MSGEDTKEQDTKFTGDGTRYAWNKLGESDQNRVIAAIKEMAVNRSGPGTSDLFYASGYHWNPFFTGGRDNQGQWCYHSNINFPTWHRVYVHVFELFMKKADLKLGNDGKITLPYWEWDQNEVFPRDVRYDLAEWDDLNENYWNRRTPGWYYLRQNYPRSVIDIYRARENTIYNSIISSRIKFLVRRAMQQDEWVYFASTAGGRISVETSHNYIHGIVGNREGPMGDPRVAAFDPIFFFHHCNVDRLFEVYIKNYNTNAKQQFLLNHQADNIELNEPFDPNRPELQGVLKRTFKASDCFDLSNFNARYDNLNVNLDVGQNLVLTEPIQVIIPRARSTYVKGSFWIYVYLVPNKQVHLFRNPGRSEDAQQYLAGTHFNFSIGVGCKNCESHGAFDIKIDVSEYLTKNNLNRHDVTVKAYLFGNAATEGVYVPIEVTKFNEPYITGSIFENKDSELSEKIHDEKNKKQLSKNRGDLLELIQFLRRFGYYDDDNNDKFNEKVTEAVKAFQKTHKLKVTGIVDKLAKEFISKYKRCGNVDGFVSTNKVKDVKVDGIVPEEYKNKKELTYTVLDIPTYLKRSEIVECLKSCFKQWSLALAGKLTFKYVDKRNDKNKDVKIDIEIDFNEGGTRNDREHSTFSFDGAGGILGHSGKGYIYFDRAERWILPNNDNKNNAYSDLNNKKTWYNNGLQQKPNISLQYVALHEIGHTLGLDHSEVQDSVMGPVYTPKFDKLQKNDLQRIGKLYKLF